MRCFLLISSILFLLCNSTAAQQDTILQTPEIENITSANANAKEIAIDMSSPEELELTLKKIHSFKFLESVVLEGKTNKDTIGKVLFRLSVLKNLKAITLKNNDLKKIPDNITGIKSLSSLTIEGNKDLDYNDLFSKLCQTQISELNLIANDLKDTPQNLSKIKTLKKIVVSGNDQLNYEMLVDNLSSLPLLTELSIPVNFITELPKNITKLTSLQVLDVSNNVLTDLPSEVSSLKAINNLSIQGNLLLNPIKELEKFQGNKILYLALDKELSGEEIEQIKKMFPLAELNFPIETEDMENEKTEDSIKTIENTPVIKKNTYTGELKAKKTSAIFSTAYLTYPALFQGVVYNFDTLNFEERYLNFRYTNIYQKVGNGIWSAGEFYFRKSLYPTEKPGKKGETWFRLSLNNQSISRNYPELRAFYGMYWVYQGDLGKKQFERKFIRKRAAIIFPKRIIWNDIRIETSKNNSMFNIYVKGNRAFEKFNAYPVSQNMPIENCQQTYNRRFIMYQKNLLRRSQNFQREQMRSKRNYDSNFKKMQDYAWKELQLRMSDEEKMMSKEEWLEYYDNIVANEQVAINNSPLVLSYIARELTLSGYNARVSLRGTNGSDGSKRFGYKTHNIDFIDANSAGKLAVTNILIVDIKNKCFSQMAGTLGLLPNIITFRQYYPYILFLELRNGNFGIVSSEEIDKQTTDPNKPSQLKVKLFDKNLDTIGDLFKGSGL